VGLTTYHLSVPNVSKSGSLDPVEPSGPDQACSVYQCVVRYIASSHGMGFLWRYFCVVIPCALVGVYRRFGRQHCRLLPLQTGGAVFPLIAVIAYH